MNQEAMSLSSWRAWIEIYSANALKWKNRSLSSWRAWIEMYPPPLRGIDRPCRSPHGERGLKFRLVNPLSKSNSRSPHGERGLK